MTEDEKWQYLQRLDDEILVGGVILSEWCAIIVQQADIAFEKGANLAAILTAVCAIETYLRSENQGRPQERLVDLINKASVESDLKEELHRLRKYRNCWVHVDDPWDDESVLEHPEDHRQDLQDMAMLAVTVLRRIIYSNQCI